MEILEDRRLSKFHLLRTHLEFLEAYLASDGKFYIPAYDMKNRKIQGFNQTSMPEGGSLEL